MANWSFLSNRIRRKAETYRIGLITVFLVVAFVTCIEGIIEISPQSLVMTAMFIGGDSDLLVVPNTKKYVNGNALNFYQ
jgi:hypothetical protein